MSSPFRRHKQRVLAGQAARAAGKVAISAAPAPPSEDTPAGSEYATLKAVLDENLRALSDIASHEARLPKKQEYARQFGDWIKGVLEADKPVQDDILLTVMIWALDCKAFDEALKMADFALRHGLAMPERYTRTVACFLAEEVAEQALKQHESMPQDVLLQVREMTEGFDMPDPVNAKLLKALGRNWFRRAEDFDPNADSAPAGGALAYVEEALAALNRALALDKEAGVIVDIRKAEAFARKLRTEAEAAKL